MTTFSRSDVTIGEKTQPPWQQLEGNAMGAGSHNPAQEWLATLKALCRGICRGSSEQGYSIHWMHCAKLSVLWPCPAAAAATHMCKTLGRCDISKHTCAQGSWLTRCLPAPWARQHDEEKGERLCLWILSYGHFKSHCLGQREIIFLPSRASINTIALLLRSSLTGFWDKSGFLLRIWCSFATKTLTRSSQGHVAQSLARLLLMFCVNTYQHKDQTWLVRESD